MTADFRTASKIAVPKAPIIKKNTPKRPDCERDFRNIVSRTLGAFNQSPNLKKKGFELAYSFEALAVKTEESGTNWGTSTYCKWGRIGVHLLYNKKSIADVASYRVQRVDGSPELVPEKLFDGAPYNTFSLHEEKTFSQFLENISRSVLAAIKKTTSTTESVTTKINRELSNIGKEQIAQFHISKLLNEAIAKLRALFPELSPKQLIEGPLAKHILGPVPEDAGRENYTLVAYTPYGASAFFIATFKDEKTGEPMVVLQRRPGDKVAYAGTGGGHQVAALHEQMRETAAREGNEEIRNDKDEAILELDPEKFTYIPESEGTDYRNYDRGGSPVTYIGYHIELDAAQAKAIQEHVERLARDETYRKAAFNNSKRETGGVEIVSLADAAAMAPELFAHPQEYRAIQRLYAAHYPERALHIPQTHYMAPAA